jgi:hypothetical protein
MESRLPETPVGKIQQIDFYRNNKLQYLIFSSTSMYLIDRNGKPVEKFPVRLPVVAQNEPVVFDYEKKRDYRIIYNSIDGKMICLDKYGKPVNGWISAVHPLRAIGPVQYFMSVNLDYLAVPTDKGWIFLNRRGGVRMQPQCSFSRQPIRFSYGSVPPETSLLERIRRQPLLYPAKRSVLQGDTSAAGNTHRVFLFSDNTQSGSSEMFFVQNDSVLVQSVGSEKHLFFRTDGSVLSGILLYKNPAGEIFLGMWSDEK